MRAAARHTPGAEPVVAVGVGDEGGVRGHGSDGPEGVTVRAAIAGAVIADQPDAAPVGIGGPPRRERPGAGGAVVDDDEVAVVDPGGVGAQGATVGRAEV